MRTLRFIVVASVFVVFMGVSALAQTPSTAKVALIDTQAFYDPKGGINKIIAGYKRLNVEMKPQLTQYQNKVNQFNTQKKSYDVLVANKGKGIPVKDSDIIAKRDQLTVLQKDIKRMQEDLKAKQSKREGEILGPIIKRIGKSIEVYAKQKGYTLVLDVGRLYNAQMLLFLDEKTNITKDFITFYNTRPAGTASK